MSKPKPQSRQSSQPQTVKAGGAVDQSSPREILRRIRPGVDLSRLRAMHPRLPIELAVLMATRAALGLQRRGHASGAELQMDVEGVKSSSTLTWPGAELSTASQHDDHRITEDGAEAIALAVAHKAKAWRVVRRLQRDEHADWLLEHLAGGER